ncbi:MAG TPA: glycosyltransferase [Patescibacteria group bacterium]|nr:glycosyltransferase [Patescibacteria group bacterium]
MIDRKGGRLSIIYVCDFNAHGGTQTHLLHLFAALDRGRFTPSLATLNLHPDLARRLRALDVEVKNLGLGGAWRPATFAGVASLTSWILRRKTDLLHGSLFQGNLLTAAVSTLSGVPCITSVRNVDLWKKTRHHLASSAAHRRARRVVFNSVAVRDRTISQEGIPLAKTAVIYNGVPDLAALRATSIGAATGQAAPDDPLFEAGRPTVVCVASLRSKKGHVHLIEAFGLVVRRLPQARLVLLGEGPLEDELRRKVAASGLEHAVLFGGYRPDAPDLVRRGDVFALSSFEEGMPNVLLEAMSAGVACVATDVGGVGEVIIDGASGYLVPAGQPALMAERLVRLLGDPSLRARLGAAARLRYETSFTLDQMTGHYETLYHDALTR